MTYRYKLSRRLAQIHDHASVVPLLLLILAAACAPGEPLAPDTPEPATQVVVSPADFEVEPDQGVLLRAVEVTSAGDSVDAGIEWSVSGGTIADSTIDGRRYAFFKAGSAEGTHPLFASKGGRADTVTARIKKGHEPPPPPPPPSGTAVDLSLHRLDGGTGDVLISTGIPLPRGWLAAGALGNVRVFVGNVEKPLYVEALKGRHADGTLRAILVQFRHTLGATPVAAQLRTDAARGATTLAKTAVTTDQPQAVALPTAPDYLVGTDLFGPTVTTAKAPQLTAFTMYEAEFVQFSDYHWNQTQDAWEGNYYDRAFSHFTHWGRSGDALYWKRAAALAVSYRQDYLEANSYSTSPHWAQLEGLAVHYWLTGDERSRTAVVQGALKLTGAFPTAKMADPTFQWNEGRIQQRVLVASLLALEVEDTSRDWGAMATAYVNGVIGLQRADGSYSWPNECGFQANFMVGLQNDALIKYYTRYRADTRIPQTVKKAIDYMWTTQWRAADQSFNYYNGACDGHGDTTPAPDVNMLIITGYGWYARVSGDATYTNRGDQIFAGAVAKAYLNGGKQFNQEYYASFNYLGYRP